MVREKIFVVEDDESLVKLIADSLDEKQYDVSLAMPNKTYLKKIEQEQPALVILDILLPGESGFDFLTELKENKKTKSGITITD